MFALDYIIKEWFLHIFRWWFVLEQMGPSVNFSCKLFLFIGTRNGNMGTSENQVTPWGSGVFWRLSEWRLWVCWFKPNWWWGWLCWRRWWSWRWLWWLRLWVFRWAHRNWGRYDFSLDDKLSNNYWDTTEMPVRKQNNES